MLIGGFSYAHDEDSNLLDSENVTLSQRKNQLSRRVRLARQSNISKLLDDHLDHGKVETDTKHREAKPSVLGLSKPANGRHDYLSDENDFSVDNTAQYVDSPVGQKHLLAKHHPEYQPLLVVPCQQKSDDGIDLSLRPSTTNVAKNPCLIENESKVGSFSRGKLFAKIQETLNNEESKTSIPTKIDEPSSSSFSRSFDSNVGRIPENTLHDASSNNEYHDSAINEYKYRGKFLSGKLPPRLRPLSPVKRTFSGKVARISENNPRTSTDLEDECCTSPFEEVENEIEENAEAMAPESQIKSEDIDQLSTTDFIRFQSHPQSPLTVGSKPTTQATAVAINALSRTATSVGMTLEQFALALQNCNNLANILSPMGESDVNPQRLDLAVALYQAENVANYKRSALLAGYVSDSTMADEFSADYLKFVVTCWEAEGKRIQSIVLQQEQNRVVDISNGNNRSAC